MKKNISAKKILSLSTAAFIAIVIPTAVQAAIFVPIVPKCGDTGCGWQDLVTMGQNIINDGVYLVAILAVISITYAGYLYVTSGGSDSQIKKAHEVFTKVIWGIFLTLGAWIIVNEVLKFLGVNKTEWSMLK